MSQAVSRVRTMPAVVLAMLLVLLSSILVVPSLAHADDTSMGGAGGSVYPATSPDIRMEAETVQAVIYGGFAEYRVDFEFANEGPAQTVLLGFPFAVTKAEPGYNSFPPTAFRAWQDGRPLDVTLGRDVAQNDARDGTVGYFLHEAPFDHGRTTITVSYLARPSMTMGSAFAEIAPPELRDLPAWETWYDYWLHTGASWKGPIGKAVVRIVPADTFTGYGAEAKRADFTYPSARLTSPESYTRSVGGELRWLFEDFEPSDSTGDGWSTYDVRFGFAQPRFAEIPAGTPLPDTGPRIVDVTASSTKNWTETAEFAPRGVADGIPNTAWCEGAPGPGIGETLRFELAAETTIREVRILPGKNRETGIFGLCGRPKSVRLTFSDGTTAAYHLEDQPVVQRFPVDARAVWAELEILDSYPGTQQHDTYISEVEFGSEPAPSFIAFQRLLNEGDAAPAPLAATATSTTAAFDAQSAGITVTGVTTGANETEAAPAGAGVWILAAAAALALAGGAAAVARRALRKT